MNLVLENLVWRGHDFELRVDAQVNAPVVGLFGESGAGKTTLLDLIAGVRVPAGGRITFDRQVFFDGENGSAVPVRERRIGYVPQDGALFPHLTVRDNVLYGAGREPASDDTFSLDHVSAILEIGGLLGRWPGSLSGGERQRVAIARALLSRPRLLLLDEPLSGLDENRKDRALALLRRVLDEFRVPMIYVSHAAREVARIASEVLVIDRGHIVRHGLPVEVFEPSLDPELKVRENFPARGIRS